MMFLWQIDNSWYKQFVLNNTGSMDVKITIEDMINKAVSIVQLIADVNGFFYSHYELFCLCKRF